jgi:hypothetical protein
MRELQILQAKNCLQEHRRNCKGHIDTAGSDKIPKQISKYQPREKRCVGEICETKEGFFM